MDIGTPSTSIEEPPSRPWRWALPLALAALLAAATGCSSQTDLAERDWVTMGTFATLSLRHADRARLEQYAPIMENTLREFESIFSVFRPDSELSRLNAAAGKAPVPVSGPVRELLELSSKYFALTDGAFDPTIGPVVRLWGFSGGKAPEQPVDAETIRAALATTGHANLSLSGNTAFLRRLGMRYDPGGIAKGYAVDACYQRLIEGGGKDVMVNVGGNIRCGGTDWTIGVRNPFHTAELVGTLHLGSGLAVATSGNYERFVTIGGERYAHIMDPRTGYPVKGMAGVTVVCPSATAADALSTGLFVMGIEEGIELLRTLPDTEAIFIPDERPLRLYITQGLRQRFTPQPAFLDTVEVLPKDG